MDYFENDLNAQNANSEATLEEISKLLNTGETLVLDIGNSYYSQADEIFDTLVMQGFDVKKSFKNGKNQIIVQKKRSAY